MRALLAVAVLLVGTGSAAASSSPVFRRENGSAIVFPGAVRAWCDSDGLHVLSLGRIRQSRWQLEVARKHVRPHHSVRFGWQSTNGIGIFVFDAKTRNEASEGTEGSRLQIVLRQASCRREAVLEIGISGTIGSEFFDGKTVRVSGTYRGAVGPPLR